MKKSVWITITVVVFVVAVGGLLIMNRNSKSSTDTSMNMSNATGSETASNGGNDNEPITTNNTNQVSIKDFAFTPAAITVKVGTTVTWTNNDSTTHTVTSTDDPVSFDSGNLAPGKSYSFTFTKAGGYKYHCSIHTDMVGSVTVTE